MRDVGEEGRLHPVELGHAVSSGAFAIGPPGILDTDSDLSGESDREGVRLLLAALEQHGTDRDTVGGQRGQDAFVSVDLRASYPFAECRDRLRRSPTSRADGAHLEAAILGEEIEGGNR